jgi:serine/threonine protein kinase
MANCVNLELVRLAANDFTELPDWLLKLPRLSWLALAGNPLCCPPSIDQQAIAEIPWSELQLLEKLGEGASGVIHKAQWKSTERHVAVKIFKGAVTSDGLPASEMAASLGVGAHPSLVEVLGKITDHPSGTDGLVMSLIDPAYKNLAGPPSLDSCTRDIYAENTRFKLRAAQRIARGIASATHQLHARGINHGDLYAHNVLWNEQGDCLLGDFGAACFYPSSLADPLQRIEVRAFGYLLEELLQRCDEADDDLWALQKRCVADDPMVRPRFEVILDELK